MAETPEFLFGRAAQCYLRAGQPQEAARCFRAAGDSVRAAEAWEAAGAIADAAIDYAAAGLTMRAAWLAVHELGDVETARDLLAAQSAESPSPDELALSAAAEGGPAAAGESPARRVADDLLRRVILARCDVVADTESDAALTTLGEVMTYLEDDLASWYAPELETWAVAVADAMTRPDLIALIFAAAVRGGDAQAAKRWDDWSRDFLEVPLQLPDPADDAVARAAPIKTTPA